MNERVPLLAPKLLEEFTPEEYRQYIKGLYFKRPAKKVAKKQREYAMTVRRLKSGQISIKTRRTPPYITHAEMQRSGLPENELFIELKAKEIRIMEHHEAERIARGINEIPF